MADEVVETLLRLEEGDEITVTVDGSDYRGRVSGTYRSEAGQTGITTSAGHLRVSLELDGETVRRHDLPDSRGRVWVDERYAGGFDWPTLHLYDPAIDTLPEKFVDSGTVDAVTVHDG